jgi:homoserine kinase
MQHFAARVPASCANLGPGFDAFAVAVDLSLEAGTTEPTEQRVTTEGEGSDDVPTDEDNLVWRALTAYCAWAGISPPAVSLRVRSDIPQERGLGSSAAAAVAGVVLGRAVTGAGGRDTDLAALAADLEGHADNAAAALLGGLCVVVDGRPHRFEPTRALRPVVCVPPTRSSTAEARSRLPSQVPLAQATANAGRAALVLAGLSGAGAWDPAVMRDWLVEPARLEALPASGALVERLRSSGVGACLSGAGPSVLAVVDAADAQAPERILAVTPADWRVLALGWNGAGARVRLLGDQLGE